MSTPYIHVRPGHPDFLDLDWSVPIDSWQGAEPSSYRRACIVTLCFVAYANHIYAVKELPVRLAYHEFDVLRTLRHKVTPLVESVGVVERRWLDPTMEASGAVITEYAEFTFTYRELIEGGGFGRHRSQMLDAFAGLLVELHLAGCFWGDCSLSNVLYRYDAGAIEAIMIDAETVELHDELTRGQRHHDIDIMITNVAGGMADIAASHGVELDHADFALGEDIAARYTALWAELTDVTTIGPDERYRIRQRVDKLNELGFDVADVELVPADDGTAAVRLRVAVAGRTYHANRLRELTRIEASEQQARQILADLRYHLAKLGEDAPTSKSVAAIQWRVDTFEPLLGRITDDIGAERDPVQAFCDFLHHRYLLATAQGRDVANTEAYDSWRTAGFPGA